MEDKKGTECLCLPEEIRGMAVRPCGRLLVIAAYSSDDSKSSDECDEGDHEGRPYYTIRVIGKATTRVAPTRRSAWSVLCVHVGATLVVAFGDCNSSFGKRNYDCFFNNNPNYFFIN